jgi:hypothetical protein
MSTTRVRPSGHVWAEAEAFYDAAELLWRDGDLARLSSPLIVNYAFSAELSLKAAETRLKQLEKPASGLIPAATIEPVVRGHKLSKLFAGLQLATRSELAARFKASTGEDLEPFLVRCSSYFEDGRYRYEQKGGSMGLTDVQTLARGLLNAVREFGLRQP